MKKEGVILLYLLLLVLLSSCYPTTKPAATISPISPSAPAMTPSQPGVTQRPAFSQTPQALIPTLSPLATPVPGLVSSVIPAATQPNPKAYIDPEGWYSVDYTGEDSSFETGYLPEMMFAPRFLDVCQWLANTQTKDTYSVSWMGTRHNSCQLVSLPAITPAVVLEVIENPSADFPHRFLYIKAEAAHFGQIANTFTWLRPMDENAKPAFHTAPLRPEDASFWENTSPLSPGISVTEYKLPPEAQEANPGQTIFLDFIPPEALPTRRQSNTTYSSDTLEKVNQTISRYGYELKTGITTYLYDLYQDGTLALKNIYRLPEVHLFQTPGGEKLVFFAYIIKNIDQPSPLGKPDNAASYLVQNETISLWENKLANPMYTGGQPIWAAGELLILGLGDHTDVQVRDSQYNLVFSFSTYFVTRIPIQRFQAWDDHWILEVSDFVIQDGEILNAKLGFEEIFDWNLINDKPFYFFRKGPRVGISYDRQFIPNYYHEIIHGYCCGLALNNPTRYENTIRFFGKRDNVWYYVVVEIK